MRKPNRISAEHRSISSSGGAGGDETAFPCTSAQLLLVAEADECSNTVRTTAISNSSRNSRTTRTIKGGRLYSSVPPNESCNSCRNCRLFKRAAATASPPSTQPQIRHVCRHANAINGSSGGGKRAPPTTKTKTSKALVEEEEGPDDNDDDNDDESEQQQQRWEQKMMMKPPVFGQGPRRRRKRPSTTCQNRRRLLLIGSVISCSLLLLFSFISLFFFFTQHSFRHTSAQQNGTGTTKTIKHDVDLSNEFDDTEVIRRLRGAYSEMRPNSSENAQIWLLNTQEFGQRARHRREMGRTMGDKSLIGLARNCGQSCTVRLKHGVKRDAKIHMDTIRIRLERQMNDEIGTNSRGRRRRRRSSTQQIFATFRPIIQTMEFDNYTLFRHSQISPKCFYIARVVDHNQAQSVVNLCDWNGGLFGTLSLPEGTFVIEPLVVIDEEQQQQQQKHSGEADNVEVRKRKRHLAAELDSDLRAHLVYRLQSHYFEDTADHHYQNGSPTTTTATTMTSSETTKEVPMPSNAPFSQQQPVDDGIDINIAKERRSKRSAISWEHFVEVLVVADNKMLLYHQHNLENYVLTLFATVSAIYRHASLGAAINVIVVKLVVLKNERSGPDVSNRAQETLQHFCKWQNSFNDRNDEALNHHDVAILLTRHDICRATNKCDTLGLAELGTMCDGRKSCAIIEDNGLSAAFTIAHELGHIFNIPHDDERKCSEFMPLNKNSFHIMAPTLEYNTNPWSWSPCSSAMLSRYLDHNRAQTQCLFDKPVERRYYDRMFEPPAPGAIYSVSQQCKFVFGAAAEICPYMPTCRRLWCSVSFGYQMGCRTQHMPWADGTPCGDNMWCHRGQCVGMSPMQRQPVDGGWGEWKPWRECSRTCGGGVQKSFRECDSPPPENSGKYCIGQRERYRPCNIQDCPWETPGFRELQCSEFDGVDIGIHGVPKTMTWVPKYTGVAENERCRLYCRATDSAAFYMLKDKVADGTPCDRNGDDICIDGTCHKAGCDHRLGSEMKRDICGVCGGNGSTCREVSGVYNERSKFGYNEVLRIPAGAAGIDITQTAHNGLKEDDNYLALRTTTGEYLLNGQFQVSVFRQQIPILDTVLEYSGSDLPIERINGSGPLRSDIYLHVLSVGNINKPNIRYHFMTPIASSTKSEAPAAATQQIQTKQSNNNAGSNSFYWQAENNWTECSMKCQGTQNQHVRCVEAFSNNFVMDAHCAAVVRPNTQKRMCNVDCFYKYLQRLNTDSSGKKWYQYICVRSYTNAGKDEQAEETECIAAGLKVPRPGGSSGTNIPQQQLMSPAVPPSTDQQQQQKQMAGGTTRNASYPAPRHRWTTNWAYSQWSQCSESCGAGGVSRRNLHCIDTRNGHKLDARFCEGVPHEPIETECNRTPCPRWVYSQWYQCSRSCGGGLRMRHASCQDAAGRELDVRMCAAEVKLDSEKCNEHSCTRWHFGQWSPCSVSCGDGVQRREAMCVREPDGQRLEEKDCEPRERIVEKQCQMAACPHWKLGTWSPCSVSCGQDGFQTRLVQCVDSEGRKVSDQKCMGIKKQQQTEKPQSYKVCSPGPCPYWRAAKWGHCSVSCGNGVRMRHVECVLKGQIVDDSLCMKAMRPKTSFRCVLLACTVWHGVPQATATGQIGERRTNWAYSQWSQCSESCGAGGVSRRNLHCIDTRNGHKLDARFCEGVPHEPIETECNRTPCPRWVYSQWYQCSRSCGGGLRMRHASCQDAAGRELDVRMCAAEVKLDSEKCNEHSCTRWHFGQWSPCSVSCGDGVQRREAMCVREPDGQRLEEKDCEPRERIVEKQCQMAACPHWKLGTWSPCSVSCGQDGFQTRLVQCVDSEGRKVSDQKCMGIKKQQQTEKPQSYKVCSPGPCPYWRAAKWGHCSVSCGNGVRMRHVECVLKGQIVDDSLCMKAMRPKTSFRCVLLACTVWHGVPQAAATGQIGERRVRKGVRGLRAVVVNGHSKNFLQNGRPSNSSSSAAVSPNCQCRCCHRVRGGRRRGRGGGAGGAHGIIGAVFGHGERDGGRGSSPGQQHAYQLQNVGGS